MGLGIQGKTPYVETEGEKIPESSPSRSSMSQKKGIFPQTFSVVKSQTVKLASSPCPPCFRGQCSDQG